MKEETIKEVERILDIFFNQEAGNRLSEFAWISFKNAVLEILRKDEKDN